MNKRQEWLEEKRTCIGASDVAPILGEDPFRGPMHVYASKVHGYGQSDSKQLMMGRIWERPIGQLYSIETEREILGEEQNETEIQYHPECPWLGSTLDDLTMGSLANPSPTYSDDVGPLELKNSSGFVSRDGKWVKIRPDEWAESSPIQYQIQLQIQMSCMDAVWGSLAALFPGMAIAWTDIKRNDAFIAAALPKLEAFWNRVERREPPSLTEMPSTLDVVKAMYPDETGDDVELSTDTEKLVREWVSNKEETAKLAKRKKWLEAQIRYEMGDGTFAPIRSMGKWLTLKKSYRKGYTKVVEPSEYRVLRLAKMK